MNREKQIDLKGMRAYEELSDIPLPIEQEEMMDIICDAWEGCQQIDCRVCTDRPHRNMRIMACTALKYTRLLREAGYRKQSGNEIFEVLDSFTDDLMKNFLALCNYNDFNKLTLLTIGEVVDRLYDKYINDAISKMKGGAE